jgi:hypothetical protein
MAAMTFFTASFFLGLSRLFSSPLSSWISPADEEVCIQSLHNYNQLPGTLCCAPFLVVEKYLPSDIVTFLQLM